MRFLAFVRSSSPGDDGVDAVVASETALKIKGHSSTLSYVGGSARACHRAPAHSDAPSLLQIPL